MPDCPQCGQTFARPFTLNRHLKSSHGVGGSTTQNQCSECQKNFSRRDLLERHRLNHHGAGRVACCICSHTFRKDYLKQHEEGCHSRRRQPGQTVFRSEHPTHGSGQCLDNVNLEQQQYPSWQTGLEPIWRTDDTVDIENHVLQDDLEHAGHSITRQEEEQLSQPNPLLHPDNTMSLSLRDATTVGIIGPPRGLKSQTSWSVPVALHLSILRQPFHFVPSFGPEQDSQGFYINPVDDPQFVETTSVAGEIRNVCVPNREYVRYPSQVGEEPVSTV